MKILNRLLILLLTSFLFLMSVGAEEPVVENKQKASVYNIENPTEETTDTLEEGGDAVVEENNNETLENIENSETAAEEENITVEAPTQATNPSTEEETSDISENGELADAQQQPDLGNFTYELIYNEDHTIATVIMEYSGECSELTLNNEDIITEVVNIGVYRVNMEYGDWVNTMAFDILVNGMFSFKINVWNGDELLETEEVSGSITGLNNDTLLFEPNQEPVTYEIISSDVGSSDSRNMTLSYETNVSFTWSIPTELPMTDIEDDLIVTVNNSNLATETALRIRVSSNNDNKLIDSASGESLSYIIKDLSDNKLNNDDVILDHLYSQDSTSNIIHFDLTQMPVMSGKYEDTLTFTASVERMLSDLYSGQTITIPNLGTTHNLTNMKIYGVSKQDGTPTPDNPVEIQSVVNPTVNVSGKNLIDVNSPNLILNSYLGGNSLVHAEDFNISDYIPVEPSCSYCLSPLLGLSANYVLYDGNKNYIQSQELADLGGSNGVIITTSETKYIRISIYKSIQSEYQLEKGITATDYEPYVGEQSETLNYTLNAIPVSSGGNVTINGQRYISDYIDIENKKLVRMVDIKELNGTEIWAGNMNWHHTIFSDASSEYSLCRTMTGLNYNEYEKYAKNKNYILCVEPHSSVIYVKVTDDYNTPELIKEYFTNNPTKLYYTANTPIEIDLSDEQVQPFKNLYTYSPTTVVSVSSDQLTPYIEFGLS